RCIAHNRTNITIDLGSPMTGGAEAFLAVVDGAGDYLLPAHGNPYVTTVTDSKNAEPPADAINTAMAKDAWTDRLKEIAVRTGRPVLSDYYRTLPHYNGWKRKTRTRLRSRRSIAWSGATDTSGGMRQAR